ncbi:MAG: beta-lactamase family protein [Candidatus Bathyarchaeota archaeon]|nr:beta-lactamase family protein [Candidatus Bathyarchaeota archaeon]
MRTGITAIIVGAMLFGGFFIQLNTHYRYHVPEQVNDGGETSDLREHGLNLQPLNKLMNRIEAGEYDKLHSILIVKDGQLVFEEYFDGYKYNFSGRGYQGEYVEFNRTTLHHMASVTKALTSALTGIAIEQGYIESVETPIYTYFPEYADSFDAQKKKITIEHLLTMSSGFDWNGMEIPVNSRNYENDLIQLFIVDDPIGYILDKPVVAGPGTRWYYSCGDVNLLGEIIKRATGRRMDIYAEEVLLKPLGISEVDWSFIQPEIVQASGSNYMLPRDMAKFGYLFMKQGKWNEQQIIPEPWVHQTMQEYISYDIPGWNEAYGTRYGYQWWLRTYEGSDYSIDVVLRSGWGCQKIILFPEYEMMIVLTGGYYIEEEPLNEILIEYIIPALII